VNADSPAAKAGIKPGDVITGVNGTAVQGANELRNLVSSLTPGSKATLTVVRDGRTDALSVMPSERESASASRAAGTTESGTLGLTVEPLTPRLADRLKVPQSTEGVVVNNVDPDGAAAAAGLETGDVIRQADGKSVRTADDLRAVAHAKSDRPALLLVQRGDRSFFTAIDRPQG
jgi:S1-C subfamily serine protease